MSILVFLKILSDAALLLTVGGPIAVHYGALIWHLLIMLSVICICDTLSFIIWCQSEKKPQITALKYLRMVPFVIPIAVAFILQISLPEIIICAIAFAYTIYIAITENYFPDYDQQKLLFKIEAGVLAAMIVILFFAGAVQLSFTLSILSGLASLVCSVLILRSLRHEPSEYSKLSFQLSNIGIMAAFAIVAAVLGSRPVITGFVKVLKVIYEAIAFVIINAVMLIIKGISAVVGWLGKLFGASEVSPPPETLAPMQISDDSPLFDDLPEAIGAPQWLRLIFIILAAIAALLIIFLIFRFISGRKHKIFTGEGENNNRKSFPTAEKSAHKEASDGRGVRRIYRKYLQYLKNNGVDITSYLTTLDIENVAPDNINREKAEELRQLYLEARYNGTSGKEQEERARDLLRQIRKESRQNA